MPQVMAFSEVYQALQTGVVDGTENILSSYTSQKYIEVQKNITLTYHTHTGYAVVMNKAFWDGLRAGPAGGRGVVDPGRDRRRTEAGRRRERGGARADPGVGQGRRCSR